MTATIRAGAALAPTRRKGKHATVKPVAGKLGEVRQALDLAGRQVGLVGRPEDSRSSARQCFPSLHPERYVPTPGVDAHDADATIVEPPESPRGSLPVLVPCRVAGSSMYASRPVWIRTMSSSRSEYSGRFEGCLDVDDVDRVAVVAVTKMGPNSGREKPGERKFVDRLRGLAANCRVVVVRGIERGWSCVCRSEL